MYLSGKYTRWYYKIVNSAKSRADNRKDATILLGYCERHHIIPKSLGGTNDKDNLVFLSAKEHFICHLLLRKMTTGKNRLKMVKAANMMGINNRHSNRYKVTSRIFEKLRNEAAVAQSILTKGKPKHSLETRKLMSIKAKGRISPNKGKRLTEEQKAELSKTKKKKGNTNTPEVVLKILKSRKGYKHSQETKDKIGKGNIGKIVTQETKNKISKSNTGRTGIKRSKETIEKMRIAAKNKPRKTCEHCSKSITNSSYIRWHGNNCKSLGIVHVVKKTGPRSQETKDKIRKANTGKVKSEETKQKQRNTMKELWRLKKTL